MRVPRSTRRLHAQAADEAQELAIVPYLDVLMNLIVFMLVSMTGLALARVVTATVAGPSGSSTASAALAITIENDGFRVGSGERATFIPQVGLGWDFEGLQRAAMTHREPGARQVVLSAAPATPYELIIQTMDAVRSGPDGAALLPEVTLAPP